VLPLLVDCGEILIVDCGAFSRAQKLLRLIEKTLGAQAAIVWPQITFIFGIKWIAHFVTEHQNKCFVLAKESRDK